MTFFIKYFFLYGLIQDLQYYLLKLVYGLLAENTFSDLRQFFLQCSQYLMFLCKIVYGGLLTDLCFVITFI